MKHISLLSVSMTLVAGAWVAYIFFSANTKVCFNLLLIAHAIFLTLFVLLFIISYKIYKIDSEIFLKKQEFERKKEWETFNYNLHKEDRLRREKYERIKAIINNLVDKEIPEKNILLKMREELGNQQALEDMKLIEEFLNKEQSANK